MREFNLEDTQFEMRVAAPTAVTGVTTLERIWQKLPTEESDLDFGLFLAASRFWLSLSTLPDSQSGWSEWLGILQSWNSKHWRLLPTRWPFDDRSWPIGQSVKGVGLSVTLWGVALDVTEDRYKVLLYTEGAIVPGTWKIRLYQVHL